jgi:Rrf2 family protein
MLSLTKKTGYGLIAMTHLATLDEGQLVSARELAGRYHLPQALLMKALKELAAGGLVESVRGARGGYRLAESPDEVTLQQIVGVLDRQMELAECLGVDESHTEVVCPIRGRCPIVDPLNRVQRKLDEFLANVKLSDLISPSFALCGCEEGDRSWL